MNESNLPVSSVPELSLSLEGYDQIVLEVIDALDQDVLEIVDRISISMLCNQLMIMKNIVDDINTTGTNGASKIESVRRAGSFVVKSDSRLTALTVCQKNILVLFDRLMINPAARIKLLAKNPPEDDNTGPDLMAQFLNYE